MNNEHTSDTWGIPRLTSCLPRTKSSQILFYSRPTQEHIVEFIMPEHNLKVFRKTGDIQRLVEQMMSDFSAHH